MAILNIWHCWRNFFATIILTPCLLTLTAYFDTLHCVHLLLLLFSSHVGFLQKKKSRTYYVSTVCYIWHKCLNLLGFLHLIAKYASNLSENIYQTNPRCKNTNIKLGYALGFYMQSIFTIFSKKILCPSKLIGIFESPYFVLDN